MKHIIMSETFIKIDSLQHLEILAYEPRKKIRVTTFTVWRYAYFSTLMPTMRTSMASTFHCDN